MSRVFFRFEIPKQTFVLSVSQFLAESTDVFVACTMQRSIHSYTERKGDCLLTKHMAWADLMCFSAKPQTQSTRNRMSIYCPQRYTPSQMRSQKVLGGDRDAIGTYVMDE